jgi:hypothetical protein
MILIRKLPVRVILKRLLMVLGVAVEVATLLSRVLVREIPPAAVVRRMPTLQEEVEAVKTEALPVQVS